MSKIAVKVSNRLRPHENVSQVKVIFEKPVGAPQSGPPFFVMKTTNAAGKAEFDPKDLPDGKYVLQILPKENWNGPVGPDVVSGHPPKRVFRVLPINVEVRAGVILSAKVASGWELNGTVTLISGKELRTTVQPVWMQSPAHESRSSTIDMIVVHHTDCNRDIALDTFMSEKGPHYMIDKDGQILKLVQESQAAWHAGVAKWAGHDNVKSRSIGIEIVNTKPEPYTEAQYTSLLELLDRLLKANSGIDPWNIVGHSDVGVNHDGSLGRKSTDPGWKFEWNRVEQKGWGLLQGAGPWPLDIYGGFFSVFGTAMLQQNDNDAARRWGGKHVTDPGVSGTPVRELQDDLTAIGYFVGTPDGGYGHKTTQAISILQEHFFAGGRGAPAKLGNVDILTAQLIKSIVSVH
jgi:N-acetyl-anhydromuramyl-L-alanine amidase AmpD